MAPSNSYGKGGEHGNRGRGGDRKRVIGENEILMLPVCPLFFGGSTVSGLNIVPRKKRRFGYEP
jgi:hypothetical protein